MTERPRRRFSQKTADFRRLTWPFSWKFMHLEGAENRRRPQIFAERRKAAGNCRLAGSVALGPSPLARPYKRHKEQTPNKSNVPAKMRGTMGALVALALRVASFEPLMACSFLQDKQSRPDSPNSEGISALL